jgi:hypothetical protein
MHDALAPAPRHQCVDAASFAAASFASTATSAARNLASTGALSVNSSSSSDSDNLKMNGGEGEGAAVGRKSTGLTDFTDSLCASPAFSDRDGDDVDAYMPTDLEASNYSFLDHLEHYMERALIS